MIVALILIVLLALLVVGLVVYIGRLTKQIASLRSASLVPFPEEDVPERDVLTAVLRVRS